MEERPQSTTEESTTLESNTTSNEEDQIFQTQMLESGPADQSAQSGPADNRAAETQQEPVTIQSTAASPTPAASTAAVDSDGFMTVPIFILLSVLVVLVVGVASTFILRRGR